MSKQKNRGKRDHSLQFWCDENEYKFIKKEAEKAGVSRSRYCRQVALGERPQSVANPVGSLTQKQARKLSADLNRIGNNLNQIARVTNANREAPASEKIRRLRVELSRTLKTIRNGFGKRGS